jgi:hypothetical protein
MYLILTTKKDGPFEFVFDYQDLPKIAKYKWHVKKCNNTYYANAYDNDVKKYVSMHRLIMGYEGCDQVDHINGKGFDNRKCNLRICRKMQNLHNRGLPSNNKTGYKGILYRKGKYDAHIGFNNKKIHLGRFTTAIEAAKAYNMASIKYHGEYGRLNEAPND